MPGYDARLRTLPIHGTYVGGVRDDQSTRHSGEYYKNMFCTCSRKIGSLEGLRVICSALRENSGLGRKRLKRLAEVWDCADERVSVRLTCSNMHMIARCPKYRWGNFQSVTRNDGRTISILVGESLSSLPDLRLSPPEIRIPSANPKWECGPVGDIWCVLVPPRTPLGAVPTSGNLNQRKSTGRVYVGRGVSEDGRSWLGDSWLRLSLLVQIQPPSQL